MRDWRRQGQDAAALDAKQADRFKSLAVHAEVKLAEALERCTRMCPTTSTSDGQPKPNTLKTAVCCQVGAWGARTKGVLACEDLPAARPHARTQHTPHSP